MPIGFSLTEISFKQPWRFPQCLHQATPPHSPWRPSGTRPLCLATPPSCFSQNKKEPDLRWGPPSPFSCDPESSRFIHLYPSRLNPGVTQVFPLPRPCPPPEGSAIWLRRQQPGLSHPRLPSNREPSPTGFPLTPDRVARSPLVPSKFPHPWMGEVGGEAVVVLPLFLGEGTPAHPPALTDVSLWSGREERVNGSGVAAPPGTPPFHRSARSPPPPPPLVFLGRRSLPDSLSAP